MKNKNTYFTAFYGIEGDALYTAIEMNKNIFPVMPVKNDINGTYCCIRTPRDQSFVDAVLNDFFVNTDDPTEKFSIVLEENEVAVCSDGKMVFALSLNDAAILYATEQIYKNLDSFRVPTLESYKYKNVVQKKLIPIVDSVDHCPGKPGQAKNI